MTAVSHLVAALGALVALGAPGLARAEEEVFAQPAPRLIDRATANLGASYLLGGVNHRGEPLLVAEVPLGPLAAVGGGYEDRLLTGATAGEATSKRDGVMWFRVGAAAGSWFPHQPALSLAFERSMSDDERAAEVRGTASDRWVSRRAGALQATVGLGVWEIAGAEGRLSQRPLPERIRPFGGVAWTPPAYPRTSLLLEGSYGPSVLDGLPRLDWRLGWGARYRAGSWSTIDLVVRNRQEAGLAGSTVMVRLSLDAV